MIDMDKINKDEILLYSEKEMGNGMIDNIHDVVFVDPDTFDKTKTWRWLKRWIRSIRR